MEPLEENAATESVKSCKCGKNDLFEYNGAKKTIKEWAEIYQIPQNTLAARLRHGWAMNRALTTLPREVITLTLDGETHTLKEWSQIKQIPVGVLRTRVKYGWSADRALSESVQRHVQQNKSEKIE